MAVVWRARDELLGRTVALKILSPALAQSGDARRRFRHEAEIASQLDHPGIAHVYESGDDSGFTYLAMEHVDGDTLADLLARRLLPIPDAVAIVEAAATALAYAHDRQVIHRDITSRNIMVAKDGRVFVLDFGLALAAGTSRITSQGTTVGTAAYLAPELLIGNDASRRSDLYGLGVVFYEALTGALPFRGETLDVLRYAALNQSTSSPRSLRPDVPAALERVVLKAVARRAEERFQDVREFLAELRGATTSVVPSPQAQGDTPGARALLEGRPVFCAVLPFESSGADEDGLLARTCSELTAALRASLGQVGRIHVVSGPEATPGSRSTEDLHELADQLGAQLLLRGSVRRRGSQLRALFEFVDARAGVRIGGGALSGSATEIFDFEDRAVAQAREALAAHRPRIGDASVARPPDPAAHERYLQGLAYLRRYDNEASVDGAIRLFEQLISTEGDVAAYHAGLARACVHKHTLTQEHVWEGRAAAACERGRSLAASAPEVQLATGELLLSAGRYDEARRAFEAAVDHDQTSFEGRLGLAQAFGRMGALGDAEQSGRRAVESRPEDWRAHNVLGWIYFQRYEHEAAVRHWRRAVELAPDNAKCRRNLGSGLYRLDRFDEAIQNYRHSLAIQPNEEAYGNLGTALYFTGRYDDALSAMRKATELAPSNAIRWGNLGNACHQLGSRLGFPGLEEEARTALDTAIGLMRERLERNPAAADWWAILAAWLAARGRETEARTATERALALAPEDPHCLVNAGYAFFELGDRDQCLRLLGRAIRAGYRVGELARSLLLAPLRGDPEFVQLLESGVDSVSAPEMFSRTAIQTRDRKGGRKCGESCSG